ncbi:MAG: GatB/YqeY domain-containing protein [Proteobacteria bacterium]|nr:GatB/YqeY domain-containing protein [Pseudomonadota bacterium]MBU4469130.1 GatB/YqeY domain-containing protein [Pseudomonadota bacterium]MCG2752162.1 GatB/YqeY domain-containing protein [Desulfobacteraceae bacterium]
MTLQEQIKQDLSLAIKAQNTEKKDALRVAMGEFGRMDKKALSDDEVVKVMIKLIKSEKELLEKSGKPLSSPFIEILEAYLPKQATEEDVVAWIQENVNFSEFKNKMQAMSVIIKHFGAQVEGNQVKAILQKMG